MQDDGSSEDGPGFEADRENDLFERMEERHYDTIVHESKLQWWYSAVAVALKHNDLQCEDCEEQLEGVLDEIMNASNTELDRENSHGSE